MKKVIVSIAMMAYVLLAFNASAQQSPTDDLFEKYGAKDGFTTVHVTKELFSLFAEISQESDDADVQEINEVVSGLEYIRILMYNAEDEAVDKDVLDDFKSELSAVKLKDFTELMTVKEGSDVVKFMIMKDGKKIKELLLLINQPDEAGFISIKGNINLKSIAKLSKSMNIDGLENLQKLNKEED